MMHGKMLTILATLSGIALANAGASPDADWIARRVAEIKQADAPALSRIPWAPSLLEARQMSQQQSRPVFLFSYDGSLDTGRC
jgi:hypothetical protein